LGKHLLASLFYVHNIVYGQPSTVNGVAWSLEVEVQFYLLAPAMIFLISRFQPDRRRIGVAVVTLALCLPTTFVVGFSILTTLHFFAVGILMADIYCIHWKERPSIHWRYDLLTLVAMPLALLSPGDHAVGGTACVAKLAWVAAIAALFTGALRGTVTHWILTRWPVYLVGGMCYTIYLWHSAYWRRLWRWLADRSVDTYYPLYFLMWGGFFLVVIVVSCAFLFLVFEKPFMRRDWQRAMLSIFRKVTGRLKGN
jgi:peptidoglycan/LPS O-acetylase OafA/YrhL